jgi:hypothetical protein
MNSSQQKMPPHVPKAGGISASGAIAAAGAGFSSILKKANSDNGSGYDDAIPTLELW